VIDWLFAVLRPAQEFFTSIEMSPLPEGLQNLGIAQCSVLRAFEQGGIFIMPHMLWHGFSGLPPYLVASYDLHGGPILIRILAGADVVKDNDAADDSKHHWTYSCLLNAFRF
jgi:hypothetical protein